MNKLNVYVKKLSKEATIPHYAKDGDAGMDLYTLENEIIPANSTMAIKTGIAMEIPKGYEMTIRPRSGISLKGCLVRTINGEDYMPVDVILGTVDSGYRGELKIITRNPNNFDILIYAGTKLAQAVIAPVEEGNIKVVDELSTSDRGADGFGSTGIQIPKAKKNILLKEQYIEQQLDVYKRKNADYGNSFELSMYKYGNTAYEIRAEDKLNRLSNLLRVEQAQVSDESIDDTLNDLFNYTAMHLAVGGPDMMTTKVVEECMRYLLEEKSVVEFVKEYRLTKDNKVLEEVENYFKVIAEN